MFQRILVPLDGSERAEQAIPLAARLAHASGGSLFFVHVVDTIREIRIHAPLATAYLREVEEHERAEALEYLMAKMEASEFAGLKMHCAVVSGSVPSTLLQVVEQERIDLIVLCSHGYTGFKRWALGSVAQKVVRQSPVPVLLLREQHLELKEKRVQPVSAVVALDGSSFSEAALVPAAHLVAALSSPEEGELILLTVAEMPGEREERECQQRGIDVNLQQATLRVADEVLQAARNRVLRNLSDGPHVRVARSIVENGDVAHALLQAAEEGKAPGMQRPCDVLALTTHGRGSIQRWIVGSVTERVLQGSMLPLLVVHASLAPSSGEAEPTPLDQA